MKPQLMRKWTAILAFYTLGAFTVLRLITVGALDAAIITGIVATVVMLISTAMPGRHAKPVPVQH